PTFTSVLKCRGAIRRIIPLPRRSIVVTFVFSYLVASLALGADPSLNFAFAADDKTKTQIYFVGPEGLLIQWGTMASGRYDSEQLVAPARDNFPQGATYRLKLRDTQSRPDVDFFATIEVPRPEHRTEAYLEKNAVPVEFDDDDLDYVMRGKPLTKVIYVP